MISRILPRSKVGLWGSVLLLAFSCSVSCRPPVRVRVFCTIPQGTWLWVQTPPRTSSGCNGRRISCGHSPRCHTLAPRNDASRSPQTFGLCCSATSKDPWPLHLPCNPSACMFLPRSFPYSQVTTQKPPPPKRRGFKVTVRLRFSSPSRPSRQSDHSSTGFRRTRNGTGS